VRNFNSIHTEIGAEDSVDHGARSFEDLLGSTGKEYGRKVTDAQRVCRRIAKADIQLAMNYHDEMEVMIPRQEVLAFQGIIEDALAKADPECTGSCSRRTKRLKR